MKAKWFVIVSVMLASTLVVTACHKKGSDGIATYLLFTEQEAKGSPYQTRILVTKDFVRFDDGAEHGDFILFDRVKQQIVSITVSNKQAMVISKHEVTIKPPVDLALSQKQLGSMQDAPAIEGNKPQHYQLLAKGKVCQDVVTVPDLLPDYVSAMREFNLILAGDSAATLNLIPADVQDDCEMARSVFAPNRALEFGLPVQEWDSRGYRRSLMDYKRDFKVEPALFVIPKDYKHISIEEIRGGQ